MIEYCVIADYGDLLNECDFWTDRIWSEREILCFEPLMYFAAQTKQNIVNKDKKQIAAIWEALEKFFEKTFTEFRKRIPSKNG